MRKIFLFTVILAVSFAACKDDNIPSIPDPEGTQEIEMVGLPPFYVDYALHINAAIYITSGGTFYGTNNENNYAKFCSVGKIDGLGYITEIPTDVVWSKSDNIHNYIYLKKGYGYIADINGIYYRLFVKDIREEFFYDEYDIPIPFNVFVIRYQYPFISE